LITYLAASSFKTVNSASQEAEIQFKDAGNVLKNKPLLLFLLVVVLASIAQSASSFYLSVYMREIGSSSTVTGTAIGVQGISELPFYFIAAWLLRKTKAINIVIIAIFGTALRLCLYYINSQPLMTIGIETLNGVTWTLLWIASVEFVNEQVPPQWRSTGQSLLWAMYFGAGAVVGNILIGQLYQTMPIKIVFGLCSLMIFIVGFFCLLIFRRRKNLTMINTNTENLKVKELVR
jgi:MFS transporter, PPP family, 3-phenylpropionic acid transporter